jgi:hypothetical protein
MELLIISVKTDLYGILVWFQFEFTWFYYRTKWFINETTGCASQNLKRSHHPGFTLKSSGFNLEPIVPTLGSPCGVEGATANALAHHFPPEVQEERYGRFMERAAAISAHRLTQNAGAG